MPPCHLSLAIEKSQPIPKRAINPLLVSAEWCRRRRREKEKREEKSYRVPQCLNWHSRNIHRWEPC